MWPTNLAIGEEIYERGSKHFNNKFQFSDILLLTQYEILQHRHQRGELNTAHREIPMVKL